MAQQRRVKPAVGVAAVGLGIGAGALGLHREAVAEPPRTTWTAPQSAASLLAEGRELIKQNRLAEALAKADAAAKFGGTAPGGDTPEALRRDAVADGKKQIEELTAQAKVLAARGDAVREKASLELARQIAAEIGQPTAPPASPVAPVAAVAPPAPVNPPAAPPVQQTVMFHPADPAPPTPPVPSLPVVPTLPDAPKAEPKPESKLPTSPTLPSLPPPAVPTLPTTPSPAEKPLLPAVPELSLNPSGPTAPPAVPVAGDPPAAPGATPVKLPKLAAAAVGAALAAAPAPAQDAAPKPGPGSESVALPLPAPATPAAPTQAPPTTPAVGGLTKEQYDALKADVDALKDYKRQVQDLLQGKSDGAAQSVLDAGVLKRLTDLEAKLDRLEKTVESMRQAVTRTEPGRTALSPPAPMPAPATKSAVKLVNDYPTDLSIILNGTSHRLKPGETKTVSVPPGSFTYELIADGATAITRTIRDDETVTLRIK